MDILALILYTVGLLLLFFGLFLRNVIKLSEELPISNETYSSSCGSELKYFIDKRRNRDIDRIASGAFWRTLEPFLDPPAAALFILITFVFIANVVL